MHTGDDIPQVNQSTSMSDAIYEMSRKKLGITAVVDDDGNLLGCISDGDLRRHIETDSRLLERTARECMQGAPQTIAASELASAALKVMEDKRITSLFICDGRRLDGIVHLHDLWRLELF
jgi:arabinose-5-phosphate isomerase